MNYFSNLKSGIEMSDEDISSFGSVPTVTGLTARNSTAAVFTWVQFLLFFMGLPRLSASRFFFFLS